MTETTAFQDACAGRATLWTNSDLQADGVAQVAALVTAQDFQSAADMWQRLMPVLSACFPELAASNGVVDSDLLSLAHLQKYMGWDHADYGRVLIKCDHALPVAGSIKARGGFFEVFCHAVDLAKTAGLVVDDQDLMPILSDAARDLFAQHTIAVGSTGNLGLSIGLAARALGFRAVVHMSFDAKAWKVERLRTHGVEVVQHSTDYASAVAVAREQSEADPNTYFVDDERSQLLFLGYSTAALHVQAQLQQQGITVDAEHPLFVYLPCGIGGAPGGVTFGLKLLFGPYVHCIFVEPTASACALVQFANGFDTPLSVYDVGLDNRTEADGLAVGEVSQFVAAVMRPLVSGVMTVDDADLFRWLYALEQAEGIKVEPSAAAGLGGPQRVLTHAAGQAYLQSHGLTDVMPNATHIIWSTGGSLVPDAQYQKFWQRGRELMGV